MSPTSSYESSTKYGVGKLVHFVTFALLNSCLLPCFRNGHRQKVWRAEPSEQSGFFKCSLEYQLCSLCPHYRWVHVIVVYCMVQFPGCSYVFIGLCWAFWWHNRRRENIWSFTSPMRDFGLILLILNMIMCKSFTGPTHFLSANVRGPVSFGVSDITPSAEPTPPCHTVTSIVRLIQLSDIYGLEF